MGEINIAHILAAKRREIGMTQEELAEYMGVSKAAVSKWENGQSYPDITLLPQLATLFNLSVDELLGYTPQITREAARKVYRKLSADFTNRPFDEVMADGRAVIKQYYSCFSFLYQMAVLFFNHCVLAGTQDKQIEVLEEVAALCKRVISESGDTNLSKDALHLQAYCHLALDAPQEVLALMGETVRLSDRSEDNIISQAFQLAGNSEKAKEITQCGMYTHLMSLLESALRYITLTENDFAAAEEAINRALALIDLFGVDNLNPNITVQVLLAGANVYSAHGNQDKAIEYLEKYVDLCTTSFFPYSLRGDSFFTAVKHWLDTSCEIGSSTPRDVRLIKQSMLQALSAYPSFATLEDAPQYKYIVRRLSDFAEAES